MYCDIREEATKKEPFTVSLQLLSNNSSRQGVKFKSFGRCLDRLCLTLWNGTISLQAKTFHSQVLKHTKLNAVKSTLACLLAFTALRTSDLCWWFAHAKCNSSSPCWRGNFSDSFVLRVVCRHLQL
jgi:hypothetical protein